MSKEKYYCARCSADMTSKKFNCYASDIDRKLICMECWQKEQPKYLVNKIADLEAKLAKSEEKKEKFECLYFEKLKDYEDLRREFNLKEVELDLSRNTSINTNKMDIIHYQAEIMELKQQLAEKEKEIEDYQKLITDICNKYRVGSLKKLPISFAVEQLERLKHDIWTDQHDDGWLDEKVDIYFLTETIDNQIKAIKEMK